MFPRESKFVNHDIHRTLGIFWAVVNLEGLLLSSLQKNKKINKKT